MIIEIKYEFMSLIRFIIIDLLIGLIIIDWPNIIPIYK